MNKKLSIYIGLSVGYNGQNNLLDKQEVIKKTIRTISSYTYGKINAFNVSEIGFYSESGYYEPSLKFSIGYNSSDFTNIKAILSSALTELKKEVKPRSYILRNPKYRWSDGIMQDMMENMGQNLLNQEITLNLGGVIYKGIVVYDNNNIIKIRTSENEIISFSKRLYNELKG